MRVIHGSSPRMRGKLTAAFVVLWRLRIIPAHAGQTIATAVAGIPRSDHPRACGANLSDLVILD